MSRVDHSVHARWEARSPARVTFQSISSPWATASGILHWRGGLHLCCNDQNWIVSTPHCYPARPQRRPLVQVCFTNGPDCTELQNERKVSTNLAGSRTIENATSRTASPEQTFMSDSIRLSSRMRARTSHILRPRKQELMLIHETKAWSPANRGILTIFSHATISR